MNRPREREKRRQVRTEGASVLALLRRSQRRRTQTEQEIGITGLEMIHLRRWKLQWRVGEGGGGGGGGKEAGREEVLPAVLCNMRPCTVIQDWNRGMRRSNTIYGYGPTVSSSLSFPIHVPPRLRRSLCPFLLPSFSLTRTPSSRQFRPLCPPLSPNLVPVFALERARRTTLVHLTYYDRCRCANGRTGSCKRTHTHVQAYADGRARMKPGGFTCAV